MILDGRAPDAIAEAARVLRAGGCGDGRRVVAIEDHVSSP